MRPKRLSSNETLDMGRERVRPIRKPLIRLRRSAAMTATYSTGSLWGLRRGVELRFSSAASPPARKRASHLLTVRRLTPNCSGSWPTLIPSLTLCTISIRLKPWFRHFEAGCSRGPPGLDLVILATTSFHDFVRVNNLFRIYSETGQGRRKQGMKKAGAVCPLRPSWSCFIWRRSIALWRKPNTLRRTPPPYAPYSSSPTDMTSTFMSPSRR